MLVVLLLLALPSLQLAQQDCARGACYPPRGDILIGRATSIHASSTCGLTKSDVFCTSYGEWQMKCCRCDSRSPQNSNGHRIENVLQSAGSQLWWQAENGVNEVSVQLDLGKKFQLHDVMLNFKGLHPAAMIIERSNDFGNTWEVYQYFADDCSKSFPWVKTGQPQTLEDIRCQKLQPTPQVPSDGKILFNPVSQAAGVGASQSQKINSLGGFTNLRVNFTKLTKPPIRGYRTPDSFYALTEMQVQGSCFCFGHADRCVPSSTPSQDPRNQLQVYDTCVCQHNTAGPNCERCAEFFNDLPWRPAEDYNPNTCKRCNCNNHAERCHFDSAVFEASGGISGGVCDGCRDNTMGKNCETCKPFFYRNAERAITHRDACIACECDPDGSLDGGRCNPVTGRCICKEHVEGERCDRCKAGFYGISASNPQGCRRCTCNSLGARTDLPCDTETGQCFCLPNVIGQNCDQCASNYWNLASGRGCKECNCDPRNSISPQCNPFTGQCLCKAGFAGRICSGCPDRTYGDMRTGCRPCNCEFSGTEGPGCDKLTGQCLCRPGVSGSRCDQCQRGYCNQYQNCVQCHPCFQFYDNELSGFAVRHNILKNASLYIEGTKGQDFGPQFSLMEYNLRQIQDTAANPLVTDGEVTEVQNAYRRIRDNYRRISPTLSVVDETAPLSREIDTVSGDLSYIIIQYQRKKDQVDSIGTTNPTGAFATIDSSYQTSTDATKRISDASQLASESREQRENVKKQLGGPDSDKEKLEGLQNLMNYPNLTPTIKKVCGGFGSEPCTPEKCTGIVCPRDSNTTCESGAYCTGTLPVARTAERDATKANRDLQNLDKQIQETEQRIKQIGKTADEVKKDAQQWAAKTTAANNQMKKDVGDVKDFIRQIRAFLSDPDIDAATIQQVSDYVLSLQLPTDSAALSKKLQDIRDLAAKLPNVDSVLKETEESIAKAKQLKVDAEKARDRAFAVEDSVDNVGDNLRQAKTALTDATGTIDRLTSSLQMITSQFAEFNEALLPSENSLSDLRNRLQKLNSGIVQLSQTTNQNRAQANLAGQSAMAANSLSDGAEQDFETVKQKFGELKDRLGQSTGIGGQTEQRITSLRQEAQFLLQESIGMMGTMEEMEAGILQGNEAILRKSAMLSGLEEEVKKIRGVIHERVEYYATC